tara:strand:+ start:2862 stop:3275 length:414 start_codon:yes stop_codon:yes gene_type:complete
MEKDKAVYNGIIIAGGLAIAFMLFLIFTVDLGEHSEYLALSLDNVADLPKSVTIGDSYGFSFTVSNVLSEQQDVEYSVILDLDGSQKTLIENKITLEPESDGNVAISFEISDPFEDGRIIVTANDLELYFSIEMEQE